MELHDTGLRCQDVHAGVHGIDPNSPALARIEDTRLVGMAVSLAGAIRGRNLISDAQMLKEVAADQLDVDVFAFDQVIRLLEETEFVHTVKRSGGKIRSFAETVPYHADLYARLGEVWRDRRPSELEQGLLETVHRLAKGPVAREELAEAVGIAAAELEPILHIASTAEIVKIIETSDGPIHYSPFFGFENPDLLADVLRAHGSDRIQEEFAAVREYQGFPVQPGTHQALEDAIARGLVIAPSVRRPDNVEQPFAAIPYLPDRELFTVKRAILDKALAILACVRCGEHFGGATRIGNPLALLNALLDPSRDHAIGAHSSARRQYQLLFRMQVMDFVPAGNWVQPRLIPTDDNVAAVRLARDLISHGEPVRDRLSEEGDARRMLMMESPYYSPLQTMQRRRRQIKLNDREYENAMDALMGRKAL